MYQSGGVEQRAQEGHGEEEEENGPCSHVNESVEGETQEERDARVGQRQDTCAVVAIAAEATTTSATSPFSGDDDDNDHDDHHDNDHDDDAVDDTANNSVKRSTRKRAALLASGESEDEKERGVRTRYRRRVEDVAG